MQPEEILLWALAALLVAGGLAGMILPVLPGGPLLFLGLLLAAWAEDFACVGGWTLGVLAVLAVSTWGVDLLAGVFGARRFGASPQALAGAGLGALIGIFGGLPGLILGPLVGAAIGEFRARRSLSGAGRAGIGATVGLVLGVVAKLGIALAMLAIFAVARFV